MHELVSGMVMLGVTFDHVSNASGLTTGGAAASETCSGARGGVPGGVPGGVASGSAGAGVMMRGTGVTGSGAAVSFACICIPSGEPAAVVLGGEACDVGDSGAGADRATTAIAKAIRTLTSAASTRLEIMAAVAAARRGREWP